MFGNIVFKFPTNRAIALISRFPGVTLNIQIYQSLIFIHEFNKTYFLCELLAFLHKYIKYKIVQMCALSIKSEKPTHAKYTGNY